MEIRVKMYRSRMAATSMDGSEMDCFDDHEDLSCVQLCQRVV